MKDQHLYTSNFGFTKTLQSFITYYCKNTKISYKQGLNEVLGPIFLIHSKINKTDFSNKINTISLSRLYNFSLSFINKFLLNFYHQLELYPLQSCLSMLKVLAKYHAPELMNLLDYALVTPEMYATSWILTLFAK